MGLVKTRRRLAEDGSPHRVMRKQQRAKVARYVTYCNMCTDAITCMPLR